MSPLKFNFVLSVDAQAGDQLDDLRDQIEALEHEFIVSRGEFLPPPWFNIFTEGTSETTRHPKQIAAMADAGYQFIILVTEQPTLVSDEGLAWNYQVTGQWGSRSEVFVTLAPSMTAAWCYAPGAANIIRRFIKRAVDIDMGWGKRFLVPRKEVQPVHDFCFFGSITPRRQKILDELEASGHSVDVVPHSSSLAERDARIPHSRVVLDIKQYHWWDLVSSVRYINALQHGRPIIAEARSGRATKRWEGVAGFAIPGYFIQAAIAALPGWKALHSAQLTKLRHRPSMMGAAINALPAPRKKATHIVSQPIFEPQPNVIIKNAPPQRPGEPPVLIGSIEGINLVQWREKIYAIPQQVGRLELDRADMARFPMIKTYPDLARAHLEISRMGLR